MVGGNSFPIRGPIASLTRTASPATHGKGASSLPSGLALALRRLNRRTTVLFDDARWPRPRAREVEAVWDRLGRSRGVGSARRARRSAEFARAQKSAPGAAVGGF